MEAQADAGSLQGTLPALDISTLWLLRCHTPVFAVSFRFPATLPPPLQLGTEKAAVDAQLESIGGTPLMPLRTGNAMAGEVLKAVRDGRDSEVSPELLHELQRQMVEAERWRAETKKVPQGRWRALRAVEWGQMSGVVRRRFALATPSGSRCIIFPSHYRCAMFAACLRECRCRFN